MRSGMRMELDFAAEALIEELGRAFLKGEAFERRLRATLDVLAEVSPEAVVRVDAQLRRLLRFWRREPTAMARLRRTDDAAFGRALLADVDGVEVLFLSHPDGRLRQAALDTFDGGLPSPYAFALVALRLNDWGEPVRRAAAECVRRTFPATSKDIVGRAALHVLASAGDWRRWTVESEALDAALAAAGAADLVVAHARDARAGPVRSQLRSALRAPTCDHGLIELARRARIPHVRALALQTLIEGRASWLAGRERRWIDKSMGEFRMAPAVASRALARPPDRGEMIALGARDASNAVRRMAADALARHWRDLPDVERLLDLFRADDHAPVRVRINFVRRRLAAPDGAIDRDASAGPG